MPFGFDKRNGRDVAFQQPVAVLREHRMVRGQRNSRSYSGRSIRSRSERIGHSCRILFAWLHLADLGDPLAYSGITRVLCMVATGQRADHRALDRYQFNYIIARILQRLSDDGSSPQASRAVLLLGILFNVIFLGVFKYTDFLSGTINDVFGANLVLRHIILPLGISFITFQEIAFLVDVQAGKVKSFTFQDYCTFVLFFPQLIAGPIVHYREMMPQFHAASCRFNGGSASCHRWRNVLFDGVDGRDRIHATALFRLFRLYGYGARPCAVLRNSAATEL
jgi:hypothetical protein